MMAKVRRRAMTPARSSLDGVGEAAVDTTVTDGARVRFRRLPAPCKCRQGRKLAPEAPGRYQHDPKARPLRRVLARLLPVALHCVDGRHLTRLCWLFRIPPLLGDLPH